MSSGPKNVTSVTNTEPPAWLAAPMKNALNAATANYRQQVGDSYQQPDAWPYGWGGPAVMQGAQLGGQVVDPGWSQEKYHDAWINRQTGGQGIAYDPSAGNYSNNVPGSLGGPAQGTSGAAPFGAKTLVPNAQNLVNNTMMGGYLGPDTNPYLQGTFNRAADLTRGRLDSEFAGSGRNLGASMPARSEELQTLASNIYGGNYQAERDRQFNAVGQAESLDPLNQYFNRIAGIVPGAGGVTTSTQPVYKTGLF